MAVSITKGRMTMDSRTYAAVERLMLERELSETKEKLRKAVEFIRKVREISEELADVVFQADCVCDADYVFLIGDEIDGILRDVDGMP